MEVTFWSCERYFMFMEKDEVVACFRHLLNKLCSLSYSENLRKRSFYALLHDQIAIKCFVYYKSQSISRLHQIDVLSYHLASVPIHINNKENIFFLLEGIYFSWFSLLEGIFVEQGKLWRPHTSLRAEAAWRCKYSLLCCSYSNFK